MKMKVNANIMKIVFVYFFGVIVLRPQTPQGFFLDDWASRQINLPSSYVDTTKPAAPADVTVSFDAADTLTKVSPYIFGHNVNTFYGVYYNNSRLLRDIKKLNAAVFRYPGGSGSNIFFWDRSSNDGIPDDANITNAKYGVSDDPNYLSLDNFYVLRDSANVTGIFVVNYAYARYGTSADPVAKAAHYAADWVRYDNGRTKFWEIGNENYGSWEEGYEIDTTLNQDGQPRIITGDLYGRHFRVFADSMRAAANEIGATIYIGAVGYKKTGTWNDEVMAQVGDVADYIIVHNYFGRRQDDDRDYILNTAFGASSPKNAVTQALADNGFAPLPVAMTEWNINEYGSMQKVSFINGLHAVLTLGQFIESGYGFVTRWNLVWRFNGGNTHGLIAADRDNDDEGISSFMPRAPFFYYHYFREFFGDVMLVSSVAGSDSVTAYASLFSNGPAGLVIINRGATEKIIAIEAENFEFDVRYYWYVLQGGNDNGEFSRKVYINGRGTSEDAGGPANYGDIKPYSAETGDSVKISLPAYSVVYFLSDNTTPVSVELASFSGSYSDGNVVLRWVTATETNNYGFEIQRAITGKSGGQFETVGFVEGAGNSNTPKEYSYTDFSISGGKYSYRLKKIDMDGSFEYSNIIEIDVGLPGKFELMQNYPNPFNPVTTIKYTIPSVVASSDLSERSSQNPVDNLSDNRQNRQIVHGILRTTNLTSSNSRNDANVQLIVYDILGRKIATLVNKKQSPGNYAVKFDASDLPSGVYFYTLKCGSRSLTRKMLLMK